ncbi:hypothetical protein OH77DRAFT_1499411 [Trametes cingulata]|nr:hypothetical protein OH77DRAFT_1499411 [Trametes cingulata]
MTVTEIPSRIQSLLTLRHPQPRAMPSLKNLGAIFSRTLQDAIAKSAEKAWLILATCTILSANMPQALVYLYHFATRDDPENGATRCASEEALDKAADMREAILKGIIFVGMPRTILCMASLHDSIEDDVKSNLRKLTLRAMTRDNVEDMSARGKAMNDSIYNPGADEVRARMSSYHPDFADVIIQSYATTLAPLPGGDEVQGNLNRALTSVVAVACLRAEGGVGELLNGHILGLLRAREVPGLDAGNYWLASDEGTEWVLRTVDAILDVVKPDLKEGSEPMQRDGSGKE